MIVDSSHLTSVIHPSFYFLLNQFSKFSPFLANSVSHHFVAHEGEVNAIRFSTQGKFLATGGADRKVKLWKEEGGKADLIGTLTGQQIMLESNEQQSGRIHAHFHISQTSQRKPTHIHNR